MSLWKAILRAFGLSNEAQVRISAPGIEVVLTGDPARVRALLPVVKEELERGPRSPAARVSRGAKRRRRTLAPPAPASDSKVVRPTELDEMDSPYALPEAVVMPVPDEDVTDERLRPAQKTGRRKSLEAPTQPRASVAEGRVAPSVAKANSLLDTQTEIPVEDEVPEEATAVSPNPSGAIPAVSRNHPRARPFLADDGPTLLPRDSDLNLDGT